MPKYANIDILGYRDKHYVVDSSRKLVRTIGDKTFVTTDYFFKSPGEAVAKNLLRYNASASGVTDVLILTLRNSFAFDKDFEKTMESGRDFTINDENKTFFRIPDISDPYTAEETSDDSGERNIRYWDFAREYDEDGVTKTEFLFVEQDMSTGWYEIFVGFLVPETMISLV